MVKERDWKEIVSFANRVLENTVENLKKEISSDINERGQGIQRRIAKSIFYLDLLKIIYGYAEIEKIQKELEKEFLPDSDESENENCCISGPRIFFKGGLVDRDIIRENENCCTFGEHVISRDDLVGKSKKIDHHLISDPMITINLSGLSEEVKNKIDGTVIKVLTSELAKKNRGS